ncbi:putative monovalent cation/H+ antiporter subunit A [Rhodosalinus sp.]|uniref:putative monovalent cation/H+ antiporter subunit A n=1 Tax=Rhodosalinus sp. TaxID=2047741 RepID=UPI003978983E
MAENGASGTARGNGLAGWLPILLAAGIFALFVSAVPEVARGEVLRWRLDWVPSLGVSLGILLDGLALTFALLISGIGTLVLLYSNTYLAGHAQYARFALFLTSFMLAMLGLVLADDLITLFVFWELTTLTSYLLIGFSHEQEGARRNALQALLVTAAGGLAFLAGLILLGFAAGTTSISGIVTQGEALTGHALYLPILILILLGAFTKSAQVPFHFWLPNAMAAPTPVSAFLHSATMVKGGVYIMARLHPALSGTDVWVWTLTIFGAATAVYASILALRQTDLKQALAYTTLMALGTLTLLLGHDSGYAMTAFATFLVVHSLYKAGLFLVVGCIDKATGTREAEVLGGLGRAMPVTALAAAVAALSMAGVPPLLGFISKELAYAGAVGLDTGAVFVAGAMLAANALMVAVAGIVALRPFWGRAGEMPRSPREAPWQMLAGPVILAALGAVFGLQAGLAQQALITPMVASLTGAAGDAKELKLWAGVNLPLVLSLVTFTLGIVLYAAHRPLRRGLAAVFGRLPSLDAGWDRLLDGLKALAAWQTRVIQNGRLDSYLAATFATVLVGLAGIMLWTGLPGIAPSPVAPTWQQAAIAALILAGATLTMVTSSRIAAVAGLGASGIGVALVFILYGAPDVAITQLLVEILVVVLLAVVMLRLPRLTRDRFRAGHAALAAGLGATVTTIVLAVLTVPFDRRLTEYFEATSWPEAFGRNIVNVILVDFRALDTFGEIAVVVIAALSAYALLRQSGKGAEK